MASEKISALPAASALDGTELVPVVQAGETRRTTVSAWPPPTVQFSGVGVYGLAQTIPDSTSTAVTVTQVLWDTDGYFDAGTPTVLTFPFAGYYAGVLDVSWEPNADGLRSLSAFILGHDWVGGGDDRNATTDPTGGSNASVAVQTERVLAGETFVLNVFQTSGTDLLMDAAFSLSYLGDRGSPPPPPPTLLLDEFVDADGTPLGSHTMDVGPGWTVLTGVVLIESDQADSSSTSDNTFARAVSDAGQGDCTLTCTVITLGSPAGDGGNGVILRATDNDNLWYVDLVEGTAGTGHFRIVERNGGSDTVRAEVFPDTLNDTAYVVQVVCDGDLITATRDGSDTVSFSPATFQQTATKFGLHGRKNVVSPLGTRFAHFRVDG